MMRPNILYPLFRDVSTLKGVGDTARTALARLLGRSKQDALYLRDLLFHLPIAIVDRRVSPPLSNARDGDIVTLPVTVQSHHPPERMHSGRPYKVLCHSAQGFITLIFFKPKPAYMASALPVGDTRIISGKIEHYGTIIQMPHPDVIAPAGAIASVMRIDVIYPLTYALSARHLEKIINQILACAPALPEWITPDMVQAKGWHDWKTALMHVHHPQDEDALHPVSPPRCRLAYDELLAAQLALGIARRRMTAEKSEPLLPASQLREQLMAQLPYQLTAGQHRVLTEIDADMGSGLRMLRLLQGDVGSGKTIIALLVMLNAVAAGTQAALMAPTELLATQSYMFIARYADALGIQVVLLKSGLTGKARKQILADIQSGTAQIVVGTHALVQDSVFFQNLALAIVDEQHRFGVAQRLALAQKNKNTHILLMTATPIPRTLALTSYGDMDISCLREKPAGRQAITTRAVPLSRVEEILGGLQRALTHGEKIYWICPLVEENDDPAVSSDLASVTSRYTEFRARFGEKVTLAHGRMKAVEREAAMNGFAADTYDVLVATTVVEVGINVPSATIIVIEHAERFGLSQLHQLRGRVGRGNKPSACILLYKDNAGAIARERLGIIRGTNDGFAIAQADMQLRGSGEVLGTRQSGLPAFRCANLDVHQELLDKAVHDAHMHLAHDPDLTTPRGRALRHLLYLLGYDEAVEFLKAG